MTGFLDGVDLTDADAIYASAMESVRTGAGLDEEDDDRCPLCGGSDAEHVEGCEDAS